MGRSFCIGFSGVCICSMFGDAVFYREKRLHQIRGMKPIFLPFPQRKSRQAHERFTVVGWRATFDLQIRRYKPETKKGGRRDTELQSVLKDKN